MVPTASFIVNLSTGTRISRSTRLASVKRDLGVFTLSWAIVFVLVADF